MRAHVIAYERCTGCHACEMACRQANGHDQDRCGMSVAVLGPWRLSEVHGVLDNIPLTTPLCNGCAARRRRGGVPACVAHCPTRCLEQVEGEEGLASISERLAAGERLLIIQR